MKLLTTWRSWNSLSLQLCKSLSKSRTLTTYQNWSKVWRDCPSLIHVSWPICLNPVNISLLVPVNCIWKFVCKIWNTTTLVFHWRSPHQLSLTEKLLKVNLLKLLCPSLQTSITESTWRLNQLTKKSLWLLKTVSSTQEMISRPELESWLTTTVGMSPMPERSGVSVQTVTVQTWLLTKLRLSNTCTKSRIPLLLLSNGLPRKVQFSVKKWDLSELTFWMLLYMPMLSTEVVVKSSQPWEELLTLVSCWLIQRSKNQFSWSKFNVQNKPSVVSTPS